MGLTIHYELHAPHITDMAAAREVVGCLQSRAREMEFDQCTDLIEWNDQAGDPDFARWHHYLMCYDTTPGKEKFLSLAPLEVVMFVIHQPGSETAAFGLGRYPPTGSDPANGVFDRPTNLKGFHWLNFCKTQYASLPIHGGWENFLKIHTGICTLLDEAKRQNILVEVRDEGEYWQKRDTHALRAQIDHWNALIAAFAGKLKDSMKDRAEGAVVAPIMEDPGFEHLEARGHAFLSHPPDVRRVENTDGPF